MTSVNTEPCFICYSIFRGIASDTHGGAIKIKNAQELKIIECKFIKCSVSGQNRGGSIYFESSKTVTITKVCAFECSAYQGFFIFTQSTTNAISKAVINQTLINNCTSSERGGCFLNYFNFLSSFYNSSFCKTNKHHNVVIRYSKRYDASYYQFYNNTQDIVFGSAVDGSDQYLKHACLISNRKSEGQYGYFHTNEYQNEVLTLSDVYAFDNENTLFNAKMGSIVVNSLICNRFSSIGMSIDMKNITVNEDFFITIRTRKGLICETHWPLKATIQRRNCEGSSQYLIITMILLVC